MTLFITLLQNKYVFGNPFISGLDAELCFFNTNGGGGGLMDKSGAVGHFFLISMIPHMTVILDFHTPRLN